MLMARANMAGAQFAGLAQAMSSRFQSAGAVEAAVKVAGMHIPEKTLPPEKPAVSETGVSEAPALEEAMQLPAAPAKPSRVTRPWQPLPLVCKRFAVGLPLVTPGADEATLRLLQFAAGANECNVTTASTTSKLFDSALGEFLPGGFKNFGTGDAIVDRASLPQTLGRNTIMDGPVRPARPSARPQAGPHKGHCREFERCGVRFDLISEQKRDEKKPTGAHSLPLNAHFWSKRLSDRHSSSGISFSMTLLWPRPQAPQPPPKESVIIKP